MLVSVVLLAHNEASVIADEIRSFNDAIVSRLPGAELVVAEDGSHDGTRERVIDVSRHVPLRLLGGAERLGYRRAVLNALASTTSQWIFFADSGLKHDPLDFWQLWNARDGHALVVGERAHRDDHWYRRLFTTVFNVVVRSVFDVTIHDSDSGFRLLHRSVADAMLASGLFFRNFSSTEIALRALAAGYRVREVPVAYHQRMGESRGMPLRGIPKSILGALSDLWRLRRELR